ncbi:MAG: PEGA domain-containing protein [Myxococcales bacterium]|nr:PEGA domain-containing protein [Myxococcales bacterium]MCB9642537.1 PEGA domain-containing protein [Myxococcales bacterium]
MFWDKNNVILQQCCVFLTCVLLGSIWTFPAHAQQRYEAYRKEVRELFQQGRQLATQRAYKRSLVKLKAAFNLLREMEREAKTPEQLARIKKSRVSFLFFLGRVQELDENLLEAVQYYKLCIKQDPESKAARAAIKALLALKPRVQGSLHITSTPPQASVKITDSSGKTYKRRTPFRLSLLPGPHTLLLRKKGYLPEKRKILIDIQEKKKISIRLLRDIKDPPPRRIVERPKPKSNPWPVVAWVGVGIAAAAVITGTALLVVVNGQVTSIEQKLGQPSASTIQIHNDYAAAQSMEIGSIAAFGVGAAALGLGITGFVMAAQVPSNK